MVPAYTASPGPFSTGMLSPVRWDSSTADVPVATVPSTGTTSPGRTSTRSPGPISERAARTVSPSRTTKAYLGVSAAIASISRRDRRWAYSSATSPRAMMKPSSAATVNSPRYSAATIAILASSPTFRCRWRSPCTVPTMIGRPVSTSDPRERTATGIGRESAKCSAARAAPRSTPAAPILTASRASRPPDPQQEGEQDHPCVSHSRAMIPRSLQMIALIFCRIATSPAISPSSRADAISFASCRWWWWWSRNAASPSGVSSIM